MKLARTQSSVRADGAYQFQKNFSAIVLATLTLAGATARADWPEFRGPYGDGHVSAPGDAKPVGLPLHWSETENIKWKTPIHDQGWSAPVVMGGQVWLTTATAEGHELYAVCLEAATGKIRFDEKIFHIDNPEPLGNGASMNCYATPSPLIEPGRVYVHFGAAGTACLDTKTGKTLWTRTDLHCRHYRGPSSSIVSYENTIILTFDGADLQYLVALDKKTGKTVWKTDRSVKWNDENDPGQMAREGDHRKAHGTPLLVMSDGKPQLISVGAKASYGYDPHNGHEIWRVEYNDFSNAPRPVFNNGVAYICTGQMKDEMLAVKTDGAGDVTGSKILWRLRNHIGKYSSPLLVDGLIYTPADESFITCIDAAKGEVVWTERLGSKFCASPIYGDGRLYFFDEEGTTTVLEPGRALKVLAKNKLDDGFMASPGVDGKALYLRTRTNLYRVEEGKN
jgi:outer membrane protein assembly factor BamB